MSIFNTNVSIFGDLTINPVNTIGNILTLDGLGKVRFRTPLEILSDINAAPSIHTHLSTDITDFAIAVAARARSRWIRPPFFAACKPARPAPARSSSSR